MALTDEQEDLVTELQDLFLPTEIVAQPYLTKLMKQFEADNALAVPGALCTDLEQAVFASGAMAANNLQGCESRLARCEGRAAYEYPPFIWQPDGVGTSEERVDDCVAGLEDLALSVNQKPPDPPDAHASDDDAA
jgi:hypothetical protein